MEDLVLESVAEVAKSEQVEESALFDAAMQLTEIVIATQREKSSLALITKDHSLGSRNACLE